MRKIVAETQEQELGIWGYVKKSKINTRCKKVGGRYGRPENIAIRLAAD
jgi:hypothetical protein